MSRRSARVIARGRYGDAVRSLGAALDAASTLPGAEPCVARIANELGVACKYAGRYGDGRRHLRRGHRLFRRLHGDPSREVAAVCHNIGGILHAEGRHDEAEVWARRAVATRIAAGGSQREVVADRAALAAVLRDLGRLDEAASLLTDALDWYERTLGRDSLEVAVTLANLAAVHVSRGNLAHACRHLRRAAAIKEQVLGRDHPSTWRTRRSLECCTAWRREDLPHHRNATVERAPRTVTKVDHTEPTST